MASTMGAVEQAAAELKILRSWVLFPPGAGLFQFLTIESLIGAARLICQNQKCAAWGKTSLQNRFGNKLCKIRTLTE